MVSPVTGPFDRSFTRNGPPNGVGNSFHWVVGSRRWSRQKPPYTYELPFEYKCTTITGSGGGSSVDYVDAYMHPALHIPSNFKDRAYAKAYERFVGKLKSDAAELGSTLATWKQSRDMIFDRATKLVKGIRAAKRGDIQTLKSSWGKKSGIRKGLKREGSNVLEYSFGWAPLVSDIANAVKVLGLGIPTPIARTRLKVPYSFNSGWVDYGAVQQSTVGSGLLEVSLRARVKVTNPNELLLNELGLANPAVVLWEVVPWSFVVDYFVNVQSFLGSFTDLLGMELERGSFTFFIKENGYVGAKWDILPLPTYSPITHSWERVEVTRSPGVPGPNLVLRLPWRMSVQRASTSIALLLQQLK